MNAAFQTDPARDHVHRLEIRAGGERYTAIVGRGLLAQLPALLFDAGLARPGARCFLGYDSRLPSPMVKAATGALEAAELLTSSAPVVAEETSKTLQGLEPLLEHIALSRLERDEPIIALGGGIVGDVVGFAAAIYRRGVPVIQCPTTLLAMVDSAIGGKTAINLAIGGELLKNLVGAFHQPRLVVADIALLDSLPPRHLRCGLAECIKHGMIGADFAEPDLLSWIESNAAAVLAREDAVLMELVARNLLLKAAVVAQDEREQADQGGRALLNLGHTFGHALETLPDARAAGAPQPGLFHGEAVGLGLIAAAHCAQEAGLLEPGLAWPGRIAKVVERCQLPVRVHVPDPQAVMARMAHDKKVKGGVPRLVLPIGPGRARLVVDPPRAAVRAAIAAITAGS